MQNCPYITIRKKWKLFEFVSGFFWKKINKNRKNTPNRALQIVNLIILFIYQKFSNMHQTMQNCLPINVQRVNRWKIEVVNVFFIDLGPPAQFVRHCRMRVNKVVNLKKDNFPNSPSDVLFLDPVISTQMHRKPRKRYEATGTWANISRRETHLCHAFEWTRHSASDSAKKRSNFHSKGLFL